MPELDFERDGAVLAAGLFGPDRIGDLGRLTAGGRPGERLLDPRLPELIAPATALARGLIGPEATPVRAVLFDKTADANWALGWHQDRTILVRERRETPGFGPWSRKGGVLHVAPPVDILAGMATLRIHIDPCGPDNAPLKIALGSHLSGLIPARAAAQVSSEHPNLACLAHAGDVWAYRTLILHASDRAQAPARRRVLQIDYACEELPGGLEWRGVTA